MTDSSEQRVEPTTTAGEPRAAEPRNGGERWHRRGGIFRLAAVVVALAGIVFIIAVVFFTGFILGAREGHEGGGGFRHESEMSHDGEPMEQGQFPGSGPGDQSDVEYGPGPGQVPQSIVPGQPARP